MECFENNSLVHMGCSAVRTEAPALTPNSLTHLTPVHQIDAILRPTTDGAIQIQHLDKPQQLLQHSFPEHSLCCEQWELI